MNGYFRSFLSALLLAVSSQLPAHAQGTAFSYQGFLTENGAPANGTYDLRFTLFDAASAGSAVGSPVDAGDVGVTNGLFTVTLDFGAAPLNGAARWVEVGVRPGASVGSHTSLAPRQSIAATPFAITAANVASNAINSVSIQNAAVIGSKIADGQVVRALNGLTDTVTIVGGGGISVTPSGSQIFLSSPTLSGTWLLGGNFSSFLDPVLGPTNTVDSFNLVISSNRALRFESRPAGPNVIGGHAANSVVPFFHGGFIGGGGSLAQPNQVTFNHGAIGGGLGNRAADRAFVGGGETNRAAGSWSSIGGGWMNVAQGSLTHIGGGQGNFTDAIAGGILTGESNVLNADYAAIGGGRRNTNVGPYSFVGGGQENRTSGLLSFIGGGSGNAATDASAVVAGGFGNTASGNSASITGGGGNVASGSQAAVLGGGVNVASGAQSAVLGGYANAAVGIESLAAGRQARAEHNRSFVWSGFNNGLTSSVPNQVLLGGDQFRFLSSLFLPYAFDGDSVFQVQGKAHFTGPVRAQAFEGDASILTGAISNALFAVTASNALSATSAFSAVRIAGLNNVQSGLWNFIGAGQYNTNTSSYGALVGGSYNSVSGSDTFTGGGLFNRVTGNSSAVLGGQFNSVSNDYAAAVGGSSGVASGIATIIIGGAFNQATGPYAVALGGGNNRASGHSSIAMGLSANAAHSGSFVWSSGTSVTSSVPGEALFSGDVFRFVPSGGLYAFHPSATFRIGGNAQVVGAMRANTFIGDGSQLSNIVTGSALTAGYATNAGIASIANSAVNFSGSLAGDVTGTQGATVVAKLMDKPLAVGAPSTNSLLRYNGVNWAAAKVDLTNDLAGTLPDARLSANVALLNSNQVFTGSNTFTGSNHFTGVIRATNTGNLFTGAFVGDGAGITNLFATGTNNDASALTVGTLADARLSANVAVRSGGNAFTGDQSFSGGRLAVGTGVAGARITVVGDGGVGGLEAYSSIVNSAVYGENTASFGYAVAGRHHGTGYAIYGHNTNSLGFAGYFDGIVRILGPASITGNVGIGVTNPTSKLQVAGVVKAGSDSTEGFEVSGLGAGYALLDRATGAAGRWSMYANNGVLAWYGNGANRMTLTSVGAVTALSFTPTSDRNAKENFQPVDPLDVLTKVVALPISQWNFKAVPGERHIGPMAQDFKAAFDTGPDDKHIATVDADGVALAAIQGLNQKLTDELKRRDAENAELKRELAEIKKLLKNLNR